jgi:hypothetical protein
MRRCPILNLALLLSGFWWSIDISCRRSQAQDSAPTEADIAAIRQQWADWRSKIVNLEFTERMWNRTLQERSFPEIAGLSEDAFIDQWATRTRWRWSDTWAHQMLIERLERGQVVSRSLSGSDGKLGYDGSSFRGAEASSKWEQFRYLGHFRDALGMRSLKNLRTAPGLWFSAEPEPEPSTLTWKPDESWNDTACARFSVTVDRNGPVNVNFWLDRSRNALPCRMNMEFDRPTGRFTIENQVTEFMELEPGLWFPKSGVDGDPDVADDWYGWRVDQASINRLTPADFRPPELEKGTLVIDPDGSLRRHGVTTPDEHVREVATQARAVNGPSDAPITATPNQDWTWWMLGLAALATLGIAVGVRRIR